MPIATAIILAAAAYGAANAQNGDGDDDGAPQDITPSFLDGKTSIDLLPFEQALTIFENPISSISFYACPSSLDEVNAICDKLEQRVQTILKANPWLGGWLVRGKGVKEVGGSQVGFDNALRVWYDTTGNEMAPTLFQRMDFDKVPLGRDTAYVEFESALEGTDAVVKRNQEAVNRKGESLFRVCVVPEPLSENSEKFKGFTLITSMSHVLGDGHTFYKIYKMLVGATPISSLTPKREPDYIHQVNQKMGRQEAHYVEHMTTDPAWAKWFKRQGSSVSENDPSDRGGGNGTQLYGKVFIINRHWVGNAKASSMTSGSFTDVCTSTLRSPMSDAQLYELQNSTSTTNSTNDILTSWFWNDVVRPDVGLMAVNLRGRIECVNENNAGNYQTPIPYARGDYEKPELIRESLRLCRRVGASGASGSVGVGSQISHLPRPTPEVTFSIVTNLASFRTPLEEESKRSEEGGGGSELWSTSEGVKLIRHLPNIQPKSMMKTMPKRMSFMMIFSSGEEDLGCALIAPGRVMGEIVSCGIVKEMIAEF